MYYRATTKFYNLYKNEMPVDPDHLAMKYTPVHRSLFTVYQFTEWLEIAVIYVVHIIICELLRFITTQTHFILEIH